MSENRTASSMASGATDGAEPSNTFSSATPGLAAHERQMALGAQLRRMETASFVEGTTLLLLLAVAVPLKHLLDWPVGVRIIGPVHGMAFLFYVWITVQTATEASWSRAETLRAIALAFIPFGALVNARTMARKMTNLYSSKAQ